MTQFVQSGVALLVMSDKEPAPLVRTRIQIGCKVVQVANKKSYHRIAFRDVDIRLRRVSA